MHSGRALSDYVRFRGPEVKTLIFEVWKDVGAVSREKVVVVRSLEDGIAGDELSYACAVGDEFSNSSERDSIV